MRTDSDCVCVPCSYHVKLEAALAAERQKGQALKRGIERMENMAEAADCDDTTRKAEILRDLSTLSYELRYADTAEAMRAALGLPADAPVREP